MISWSYYGETGVFLNKYLFKSYASKNGERLIYGFKLFFVYMIYRGAINSLDVVVNFSDLMLGLLVIPNTIAILYLAPVVKKLSQDYFLN